MPGTRFHLSFHQLLLIAFMLVGALLGGTALRAVVVLDRLMAQSGMSTAAALELNASAQALAERTVDMERAARQSLILGDAVLRKRFDEEAANARSALRRLTDQGLTPDQAQRWHAQLAQVEELLRGPAATALDRERLVAQRFREFDGINTGIAREVQGLIGERNRLLRERLDNSRSRLMQQVIVVLLLTSLLIAGLGIWLSRPFKRLEAAIASLGQDRLDDPIEIQGPQDVRRLSQQLDWLRLRLTELDADKARFLRHVSHELKTPLAALREGVSLLQEGVAGDLSSRQQDVVRILQHNTAGLQQRIEALLRFNAAAFEARQLRRRPTDLLALLQEQVEMQRLQWHAKELTVDVEGESVVAPVDPDKLGTALANLLTNAIRFSPHGGRIRLRLRRLGAAVEIDVCDEGPGIAETDRDRVFEPFYRGERQPQDAPPGTGIGLSIVQEYIAAHGGRVTLPPHAPKGAHFQIELPHAP
ncbi:HAMP domain-containing histidine kinase [Ramlibacter henchirensis]|uniref:Signal transduction histidine-protein kinase/phosphatase MprB n=1 Tax=Ramlibacter henchirensis TaxID=204072 RepID=A0A4Z0C8T1_9BURK|nr:HAMP domain-containing sensor histidine kinase [Ramlibacter henchirensis]TFZ06495.1 HAMP domain-containing histidine kinase [Ramlibacter henchirensis]